MMQKHSPARRWATRVALLLLGASVSTLPACRRATPVTEISIEASGVQLHDLEPLADAPWPNWRGPLGNGHVQDAPAADASQPTVWSESQAIVWMADVPGRGHGSPIVVGDLVLLASAIENGKPENEKQQVVLAYDRSTGSKLWETVVHEGGFPSTREIHNKGTNANGTLASDGQHVYAAFFNSGKIIATALDRSGNEVWSAELGAFGSKFGFAPSPILYKSFVIVAADNWGGGYITALDGATGTIAWRIARPAMNSHSSPLIASLGGRDQLLICGCEQVASYDPATGEEIWSTACTTETTCGTMVVQGDKAFASGGYPDKQTVCLDPTGQLLWENRDDIYEPSLLVDGENLFAVSDKGIAYCWSNETGEVRWRKRLGGNFSSSPILWGGLLYASDLSGNTYVFRATGDDYQEVAVNRLGSDCYASPAVADGQLLMRVGFGSGPQRHEKLCCIGAVSGK